MKNIGVIAEFNPFHNGHKYLLDNIRQKYKADCIVVIMSGTFVQRGDLSIIDKWQRAKVAVMNGANLVLELPIPYAIQSADFFASGALAVLSKLEIPYICFGTETNNINLLQALAKNMAFETDAYKEKLRVSLKTGLSYPRALSSSVNHFAAKDIFTPNNILALEYMKTIIRNQYKIEPLHILRKGSDYNSTNLATDFSSATAIRAKMLDGHLFDISKNVPENSYSSIREFYEEYNRFNTLENLIREIKFKIITTDIQKLSSIHEVSEGIENKILKNIMHGENIDDIIHSIKSKRYTYARIRRILLNALLDLDDHFYNSLQLDDIHCIKVLAFDKTGQGFLKSNKNNVHFITKKSDFDEQQASDTDIKINKLTNHSTNIYHLALNSGRYNEESFKNPFIIKEMA
jgi:predicted nucleotidyltransferase